MLHSIAQEHNFIFEQLETCFRRSKPIWMEGKRDSHAYHDLLESIRQLDIPSCMWMLESDQGSQDYTITLYELSKNVAEQDLGLAMEGLGGLVQEYALELSSGSLDSLFLTSVGVLSSGSTPPKSQLGLAFSRNAGSLQIHKLQHGSQADLDLLGLEYTNLLLSESCGTKAIKEDKVATLARYGRALLLGMLTGTLKRMLKEAMAYSRVRKSSGKAIFHHQAISLRLGSIAMDYESLDLLAKQSFLVRDQPLQLKSFLAALSHYAHGVCKESVQVAGGHGYVDGLPLKRLYEESKGFVSFLILVLEG
ncbi:acyl-CoA dehydrogenase family protein [Pseudobacteriovorax antillogorgiicola]|uniref:Acyl-CoA dehydrogenase, C-terminal domain n=1 Tax=Pseudobacteriovorax antillogorgiicola TaxID=1513793 RepID=A0A1Y6C1V1_9BACT|nr:acyl-CoA dehydrogenase family protein [Pseudobacteriovorax antillogorgiicola]TCS51192.1 acyl-CoA dehydrogenase-like protein [Pseudobacteriovorax antillogorgiicola]SMF37520.1 Acyl-CoA dehydrogenase, C-terminal domain [Pseudobacteriovorax antillogorgiicola]